MGSLLRSENQCRLKLRAMTDKAHSEQFFGDTRDFWWNKDFIELMARRWERGKKKLGLGFNSLGCLVPGYFSELGLKNIQDYVSDKAVPLFPPYQSLEQQVLKTELVSWAEQGLYLWDVAETQKYFLADGGTPEEFQALWNKAGKIKNRVKEQLLDNRYCSAGGALTYLTSGRKQTSSG